VTTTREIDQDQLLGVAAQVMFPTYRPALVIGHGRGRHVTSTAGVEYLDLTGGNAVSSVGNAHPQVTAAIAAQAEHIVHTSNLVCNDQTVLLAAQLCERTPFGRVFFCNSGSEANETLLKLARRYFHETGDPRTQVIATTTGFHGRTYGALSLTGRPKHRIGAGPLLDDITHVRINDLDEITAVISRRTAAVIVETIQAEAGVIEADPHYLRGLRRLCDDHGALLLFDEVQTGVCRTGPFLSFETLGVVPDACSIAKGVAAGLPMGAVLAREFLAPGLPGGSHASTFGGNPVAAAAARAVLEIIDRDNLPAHVDSIGAVLADKLRVLAADPALPTVAARGTGLLQGLQLRPDIDPQRVLTRLRDSGVLLSVVGGTVLRFTPALNLTEEELDQGIATLHAVLHHHTKGAL
jgi:acetylornithine/succinyldiaminopimelate/putrescine aminotransferase